MHGSVAEQRAAPFAKHGIYKEGQGRTRYASTDESRRRFHINPLSSSDDLFARLRPNESHRGLMVYGV
jgi:hypothetical protein